MRFNLSLILFFGFVLFEINAQRIYYESGYPPSPGFRNSGLRSRSFGRSARLQQIDDGTSQQQEPAQPNSMGSPDYTAEPDDGLTTEQPNMGSPNEQGPGSIGDDQDNDVGTTLGPMGAIDDQGQIDGDADGDMPIRPMTNGMMGGSKRPIGGSSNGNGKRPNGGMDGNGGSGSYGGNGASNNGGSSSHGGADDDHHSGDPIDWLRNAIRGEPGKDYPIYAEVPMTSFKCADQKFPGYYADVEAQCQVFHICQKDGRMDSFLCPNGTIFNQQYFVCVWWHDADCSMAESFYNLNEGLYIEQAGYGGASDAGSSNGGNNGGIGGSEDGGILRPISKDSGDSGAIDMPIDDGSTDGGVTGEGQTGETLPPEIDGGSDSTESPEDDGTQSATDSPVPIGGGGDNSGTDTGAGFGTVKGGIRRGSALGRYRSAAAQGRRRAASRGFSRVSGGRRSSGRRNTLRRGRVNGRRAHAVRRVVARPVRRNFSRNHGSRRSRHSRSSNRRF